MLIVVVPILINKDVFEPSYNDWKFTAQNHNYCFTNLILKHAVLLMSGLWNGTSCQELSVYGMCREPGKPKPSWVHLFGVFFASSTWLCPTLYLFPDLCSRCLKVSYPELSTDQLPGLDLLTQVWRSEHPSSSSCLDMILEESPGTVILPLTQVPAPSREEWLTYKSLPSPGPMPAGSVSPTIFPTVMNAASRSFST